MPTLPAEYNLVIAVAIALIVGAGGVANFFRGLKKAPDVPTSIASIGMALNDRPALTDIAAAIRERGKTFDDLDETLKDVCRALDRLCRSVDEATGEMRRH